ncbi:MAG: hypothetical protein ACRCUI_03745 [Polymorphobacter sp.]
MKRWILGLVLATSAVPLSAQSLEDRMRDQLRSSVTQLREAQAALAQAQADKAAVEKERDALRAKAGSGGATPRELAAARAAATDAESRARAAEAAQAQTGSELATLRTQLVQSKADVARLNASVAQASGRQARLDYALDSCVADNNAVVVTGKEVLAAYVARFGEGQFPPLQLARTRFENAAQGYGDRIAAGVYTKPANIDAAPLPPAAGLNSVNGAPIPETATNPK